MIEIKSARKNTSSMLTLFTKAPLPRKANSLLVSRFGYPSMKKGGKRLQTTVNAVEYNQIKGEVGFRIDIQEDRISLIDKDAEVLGYWDRKTLQESFERKLPNLVYVKAQARGKGSEEEFWFDDAWMLSGFEFKNFVQMLREKVIYVDIRIGQYTNGKTHDHGTGFRVFPDKFDLCFSHRERIM